MRLDQVLADLLPEYSRTRLQNWNKSGYIKVDNNQLSQREKLKGGEFIHINVNSHT